MCSKQLPVNMEDLPMKVFRPRLLISVALLSLTMSCQSIALASPISGNNGQASDDATLTADMLTSTQITEKTAYGYTEVDYAIRELMVASDVSFLGFDCGLAILPLVSSKEMLMLSMEQATACFSTEQGNTINNQAVFRPSSGNLVSGMTNTIATGACRTDHNS